MKKIAFMITSLEGGGAERVVANLLNELNSDFEIHLVLQNNQIAYDIPPLANKYILFPTKLNKIIKMVFIPYFALRMKSYLVKNQINCVISFMEYPNWITLFMRFFGWKGKTIICEQVSPIKEYDKKKMKGIYGIYLNKWLYPKANTIVSCSKGIKFELENTLQIECTHKTIYNPINILQINNQINNTIRKKHEKFTFINVSGFRPQKNHLLLLEAFSELENCQLILVGKEHEPINKLIKNKIEELKIGNRVVLTGFTNNPYPFMINADCFVLSSNYEGLPNVVLEAMMCNLPIISTDCKTGPREILAPKTDINIQLTDDFEIAEYGILVPIENKKLLRDSMKLIMEDSALRDYLGNQSTIRYKDFSLEKIAKEYAEILTCD